MADDRLPDVAALRAQGRGRLADEWDRRMQILSEFEAARSPGKKTAAAQRIAAEHGISVTVLYAWRRLLEEGGPVALVPGWNPRRGTTLPAELQHQIRAFFLDGRQATVAQVYRHVVLPFFAERGEDPPSYATVRRFVRADILPVEAAFWRESRRDFEATFALKVERDSASLGVNEVWCADHRKWDVFVFVPDGKGTGWLPHDRLECPCGSGKERRNCCSLRRPWVTMIADVKSAAWVGYRIGLAPSAAGVCHALREAILRFGVPQAFYRDHGKEFLANRLGGKPGRDASRGAAEEDGARGAALLPREVEMCGVWNALGVRLVTALPYHAWSKPIESFFAAFSRLWENLCPGWCGRRPDKKPPMLNRQIRNGTLLTLDQFEQVFADRVEHWNKEHVCGDREGPPLSYYQDYIARVPAPAVLCFLLQDQREALVGTRGIRLWSDGKAYDFVSAELGCYVGDRVRLRWDPGSPDKIYAYTRDGRVLEVPRLRKVEWGAFAEMHGVVARSRELQREYLRGRAGEIADAPRHDPVGALGLIASHGVERLPVQLTGAPNREGLELAEAGRGFVEQARASRKLKGQRAIG